MSRPCLRGATLGATARPGEAFEANVDSLYILRAPRALKMFRSLFGHSLITLVFTETSVMILTGDVSPLSPAVEGAEQGMFSVIENSALAALGGVTTRPAGTSPPRPPAARPVSDGTPATRSNAPGATERHFAAASPRGRSHSPTRRPRPLNAS